MDYVSQCVVPKRPHTLAYIDIQDAAPSTQQYIADIVQYEIALEEMTAATLDKDYMEELADIELWFRLLSDAERAASLYTFAQQITQGNIRFLLQVLQQMAKSHPMSL